MQIYHGKIIVFCTQASAGVVSDSSGKNYTFYTHDWMEHPSELQKDIPVEFSVTGGRAVKVSKSAGLSKSA